MIMHIPFAAMIGPVLATVRALTGKSQVAFAEPVGVAGGQFSRYERSKAIPDIETAMRLLAAGGWRFAAISEDEAATWEERDAVVRAAQAYHGAGNLDEYHALIASVEALAEAEQNVRDAGKPMLGEELVAARLTMAEQHAELVKLRHQVEVLGRKGNAYRDVLLGLADSLAGSLDGIADGMEAKR